MNDLIEESEPSVNPMEEFLANLRTTQMTKEEFDKLLILDLDLERDETDEKQRVILRATSGSIDSEYGAYLIEVVQSDNKITAEAKKVKFIDDHSTNDDPSLIGC